jgi:hypothetical protein
LVRPHDADVQLQAGFEAWAEGDLATAQASWSNACHDEPDARWKFLPLVAERFPPAEAADFLPLDFESLKWLAQTETALGRHDGLDHVLERAQKAIEDDPLRAKKSNSWVALYELYRDAQLDEGAEASLRCALRRAPSDLNCQARLIRWMMVHGRWDDALRQAQAARHSCTSSAELQNLIQDILHRKAPPAETNDHVKVPVSFNSRAGSSPP